MLTDNNDKMKVWCGECNVECFVELLFLKQRKHLTLHVEKEKEEDSDWIFWQLAQAVKVTHLIILLLLFSCHFNKRHHLLLECSGQCFTQRYLQSDRHTKKNNNVNTTIVRVPMAVYCKKKKNPWGWLRISHWLKSKPNTVYKMRIRQGTAPWYTYTVNLLSVRMHNSESSWYHFNTSSISKKHTCSCYTNAWVCIAQWLNEIAKIAINKLLMGRVSSLLA